MQTQTLRITGMTCGGCTNKATRALKGVPGVVNVEVSLSGGEATVQYDERRASVDRLTSAVKTAGYGVAALKPVAVTPSKASCCG